MGLLEKLIHLIFCWYVKLKLPRVTFLEGPDERAQPRWRCQSKWWECVVGQRPLWAVLLQCHFIF
jgi:hypothetical protein